jgi:hypothetical protein
VPPPGQRPRPGRPQRADARLIGIECIITEERFLGLPEDEKRLWHSHDYEVKSGILVARASPMPRNTRTSATL